MSDHEHVNDQPAGQSTGAEGKMWTCPMHPEVRTAQPGRCPKCRMFLVEAK